MMVGWITLGFTAGAVLLERRDLRVIALGTCRCQRIDGEELREALTGSPPSSSLLENARRRLAITHPSREATGLGS